MKHLTAVLVLWCLCSTASAAIPATAVWEVRPTTGSNLNGGGYDSALTGVGSSVDCSQTGTILSFTGLTAEASSTLTDSSAQFTAAHVGNAIHLESASVGTPGYYFITVFTDASTVTIDRSTTITTGVGKLCGPTKSFNGQTTTTLAASLVGGNIVYVKNEAWNEAVTLSASGTSSSSILVEGYNTTRGDAPTGTSRPTNARALAGAVAMTISGAFYQVNHLVVSAAGTNGWNFSGGNIVLWNVRATACGLAGFLSPGGNVTLLQCEADLNGSIGVSVTTAVGTVLYGCYVHNNVTSGVNTSNNGYVGIYNSIVTGNTSHGISVSAGAPVLHVIGNTINCNSSTGSCGASTVDGVNMAAGLVFNAGSIFLNNIFSNNGRYGVNKVTPVGVNTNLWLDYNNYFGNGTAARNNVPVGPHDLALDPSYANAAAGNYAIGTSLRAKGYPGLFPAALTTGFRDIGAVQSPGEVLFHVFP